MTHFSDALFTWFASSRIGHYGDETARSKVEETQVCDHAAMLELEQLTLRVLLPRRMQVSGPSWTPK